MEDQAGEGDNLKILIWPFASGNVGIFGAEVMTKWQSLRRLYM